LDPFVRRLVERLLDPSRPLSRNRHFHTFDTPEGKRALRLCRRLQGLRKDLLTAQAAGERAQVRERQQGDEVWLEVSFRHLGARRVSALTREELELLCRLPGVTRALDDLTG
jgi:hypothetical protein